ncbi:intein-containing phosphoenolpyruvate synthase [Methanocaldococcus sp.]
MKFIAWLDELSNKDVNIAGGKGASLGEMWNAGLPVPPAFVVTADAYRYFIKETGLIDKIKEILKNLDINDTDKLNEASEKIRKMFEEVEMPDDLKLAIIEAYNKLSEICNEEDVTVAVRSSATAEDLPDASFAGQQDTYLNIKGAENVVKYVQKCFSSLFTPRAIFYREQKGFDHFKVALAVVVQKLVNSEKAGVMFTVNPITENYDELVIEAAWGLGEGVVSGSVSPDTYIVNKKTLEIIDKHIARKEIMFVKDEKGETKIVDVPEDMKEKQVLTDDEIKELAKIGINIENHYKKPMDVEWAYEKGKFYMVQARPITTLKKGKKEKKTVSEEDIESKILLKGIGASPGIATGPVKIIMDVKEIDKVKEGDILVTKMTTPDMVPAMKKAAAIITDEGGLTCIEGDAKILTDRGFMKIKDIYKLVKKGEKLKVLGLNSKTLKTEWKEVIDAQVRTAVRYEVGVYRKNKKTTDTIKITPDHKFPIFKDGGLQKIPLEDVINNNYSVLSIDYIPMIEEKYETLSDIMYLCGAILSDGHIVRKKDGRPFRVRFTQKNTEEKREFINKVLEDIKHINGEFRPFSNVRNGVVEYQTSKKQPSKILGYVEDNINTIPLYATESELIDFLAGYVDGDGYISSRSRLEIYENVEHKKKIEGIILALYRIGAIPRMRVKKGTKTAVISIKNNIEKILSKTKRISIEKLNEFDSKIKVDAKLIDIAQMLPECKEYDYRGYLYKYFKNKSFIGVNKLYTYLKECKKVDTGLKSLLKKVELIKDSDIHSIRLTKINEDYGEVYNITVKANNDFDHNYVVWTKNYTPIVVFNCHAAIVSRELGTPCVVGTKKATEILKDGMIVTVDGEKGIVYEGEIKKVEEEKKPEVSTTIVQQVPIITATEVKVNVSMPEVAERAAATGADGVGLLRAEHMILGLGKHPKKILEEEGEEALIEALMEGIRKVADAFYPRPVTYRTLDAPTDEFRGLEGGENEPIEHNPMLGWRGIRRGLDEVDILKCELKAIKRLREEGYKNIEIMIPLVTHPDEVKKVKEIARDVGLELGKDIPFGIMVETPAAALIIEDFIKEGINFVSLGTNDLTQYTIAIDRNNELVSKYYKEDHPAVLKLVEYVIKTCKKHGIKTSICGQAGSRPHIVEKLVEWGIDSVSANIDAVETIRRVVARTEQKVILNFIRKSYLEKE